MNQEIQVKTPENLTLEDVKRFLCDSKLVSEKELYMFLQIAKMNKLNPFKRELYLIKYEGKPAHIVTGYDVYLKRAQRSGDWAGLSAVRFEGSVEDGSLCATVDVYKKGLDRPFYTHTVDYEEYVQKKSDGKPNRFWAEKPKTMLRKVCIAQAIRMSYPDEFDGMPYVREEMNDNDEASQGKPEVKMPLGKSETPAPETQKAEDAKTEPIPIITKEQGVALLTLAVKNGWKKKDVQDYISTLGYKKHTELNQWDLETVTAFFSKNKDQFEKEQADGIKN